MWWRASVYLLIPRQSRSSSMMRISVMLYRASSAWLFSGYVADNYGRRLILLSNVVSVAAAIVLLRRHFPKVPASSD